MAAISIGEIVMRFGRIRKGGYENTEFFDGIVGMAQLILEGGERQTRLELELSRGIRGQGLTQIINSGKVLLLRLEDLGEAKRRRAGSWVDSERSLELFRRSVKIAQRLKGHPQGVARRKIIRFLLDDPS